VSSVHHHDPVRLELFSKRAGHLFENPALKVCPRRVLVALNSDEGEVPALQDPLLAQLGAATLDPDEVRTRIYRVKLTRSIIGWSAVRAPSVGATAASGGRWSAGTGAGASAGSRTGTSPRGDTATRTTGAGTAAATAPSRRVPASGNQRADLIRVQLVGPSLKLGELIGARHREGKFGHTQLFDRSRDSGHVLDVGKRHRRQFCAGGRHRCGQRGQSGIHVHHRLRLFRCSARKAPTSPAATAATGGHTRGLRRGRCGATCRSLSVGREIAEDKPGRSQNQRDACCVNSIHGQALEIVA
jgi:hypothetical protein